MTKSAQNLLLITLGAATLWITVATDEYLNYVKPWFRWALIAAAVAVVVLGAAGLRREWHDADDHDDHGHDDHGHHGPRVAWLLCLPALGIFLIAPPALGSFTADRNSTRTAAPPAPDEGYGALRPTGGPLAMTISEFIGRSFEAQTGDPGTLRGIPVQLSGFAAPRPQGEGWYLTRLRMACCAGDAIPMRVIVHGAARPKTDTWVSVVGTWMPPTAGAPVTGVHEVRAQHTRPIKKPKNQYE
ncbi:TIGR03943 family putative permease subunit [Actinomadura craniellae]|uniref:TIGR03943 family putative permease subunit n=1 Tax=Actinomadura craniellae TaxID=2231787 RepID=UPI001313FF29|nr:TIGR03943 family protein [Actinomadura craniellae]